MSKGSERRPGEGYEQNWDQIFGKREPVVPKELISPTTNGEKADKNRTTEKENNK